MKAVDLTGKTFGRLTIKGKTDPHTYPSGRKRFKWECLCECGNITYALSSSLGSGATTSCGCLLTEVLNERNTTHGLANHPLYSTWINMIQRCYSENNKDYHHYGDRGIKVQQSWRDSPQVFFNYLLNTLGPRPEGMTMDRINNDGHYEEDNLRWATAKQQNNNTRRRRRC